MCSMSKVDEALNVLNESNYDMPTKIEVGKTYKDPQGHEIVIHAIWVTDFHKSSPTTMIQYDYSTRDGRTGDEVNSVGALQSFFTEEDEE